MSAWVTSPKGTVSILVSDIRKLTIEQSICSILLYSIFVHHKDGARTFFHEGTREQCDSVMQDIIAQSIKGDTQSQSIELVRDLFSRLVGGVGQGPLDPFGPVSGN